MDLRTITEIPAHPPRDIVVFELQKGVPNPEISCVIPCLNEEGNVAGTMETLETALQQLGKTYEIIVFDDGSSDNTFRAACEYAAQHPASAIRVVHFPKNRGLSQVYSDGAFLARGQFYRMVMGDNVEPVETFVKIFSLAGKADMIVTHQPHVPGRPLSRVVISRTFTFLVNTVSGHRLKYYNGCPLIRRQLVMRWHSYSTGFGFQADMVTRILDEGASYIEIPVLAIERQKGKSKALSLYNFASVGHVLFEILVRRTRRLLFKKPSVSSPAQQVAIPNGFE